MDSQHLDPQVVRAQLCWRLPALVAAALLMVSGCASFEEPDTADERVGEAESDGDGDPDQARGSEELAVEENAAEDDDTQDADANAEDAESDESATGGSGSEEQDQGDPSEPVIVQETVWDFDAQQEVDVEVTIYPFMRDTYDGEDFISGHMTYEVTSEEGEFALSDYGTMPSEVRLLDPENPELVYHPTVASTDANAEAVADVERNSVAAGEEPARWGAIYADPGTESTAVLLPYIGLVTDVGIVDPEEAASEKYITFGQVEGINEVGLSNFSIETYRERAGGDINVRDEQGQAVITLDAQILFDSDEHVIRDEAEDALLAAVDELERAAAGELVVVGHTDNVDTEEYNQALSENRAEAVRERLDELLDLSEFDDVSTEGRSLREPIATNETDEGRQLNRRVELHFTPAELGEINDADRDTGELPEAQGPEAGADEPVTVSFADGRAAEVSVESVQRLGELMIGRVTVEIIELSEDEEDAAALAWPLSFGTTGAREDHEHQFNQGTQTDALTLLLGDERVFPLEYMGEGSFEQDDDGELLEEDYPWYLPLTDRGFGFNAEEEVGTRATTTVLWPAVPGETVTIDVPGETEHSHRPYADPFRFNEVPVQEAEASGDGEPEE